MEFPSAVSLYKKSNGPCGWRVCHTFHFLSNSGNKLGGWKKASAIMTLAVQQRNHFGCCCTNRLWLRHTASASSPSVTHKRGSSRLRDVRTIASIYAGQERVDEELHVLPLNYHAPTASGHNGPWCNLGTHSETRQTAKIACGWSVIRGWNMRCETCDARDDSGT